MKLTELLNNNWKDTGLRYADCYILAKGYKRMIYDIEEERSIVEYSLINNKTKYDFVNENIQK
jgi:hypothetical protein